MTGSRPAIALMIGLLALLLGGAAQAQEDLAAGKTPEQLFRQNCAACHKSPRGLAEAGEKAGGLLSGLESFLAQHYTASSRSAKVIAAYLKSVGSAAPHRSGRHPQRRASKPKKPAAAKKSDNADKKTGEGKADEAKAKMTDEKPAKPATKKPATKKPETKEPETNKPKTEKPAATKPDKKKPVSPSSEAKREKPVPTEKKTD